MTRSDGMIGLMGGAATDGVTAPPRLLSMCDELADAPEFAAYLHSLPADELWDVLSHLDAERYPARVALTRREIDGRRLDFVSLYSPLEQRLRNLFGLSVGFAVLAACLHPLAQVIIPLEPGEHLTWFFDLAVGGPAAARVLLPLVQLLTIGGVVLTVGGVGLAIGRRMRRDVFLMGVVSALLILGFGRLAGIG